MHKAGAEGLISLCLLFSQFDSLMDWICVYAMVSTCRYKIMKFTRNVLAFILRSPLHTFLQTVMASVAEATYRKRLEKKEEAVKSECKLSGDPPPSPPLLQRVLDALRPFLIIAMMIIKGFPAAIFFQMTHPSIHLFNPFRWIRLVQECGFAKILAFGDVIWRGYKQPLVEQASGKVLEIGAGTGENLKYYKNDNVSMTCVFLTLPAYKQRLRHSTHSNLSKH